MRRHLGGWRTERAVLTPTQLRDLMEARLQAHVPASVPTFVKGLVTTTMEGLMEQVSALSRTPRVIARATGWRSVSVPGQRPRAHEAQMQEREKHLADSAPRWRGCGREVACGIVDMKVATKQPPIFLVRSAKRVFTDVKTEGAE